MLLWQSVLEALDSLSSNKLRSGLTVLGVVGVPPILTDTVEVSAAGETTFTTGVGVVPEHQSVRNITMLEGEFVSEVHMLGRSAAVVLGPDVAETLVGRRGRRE